MPPDRPFVGHIAKTAAPIIDAASLPLTFQLALTYLRIDVKPPDGDRFSTCLDTDSSVSLIDKAMLKLFRHELAPSDLVIRTASTPTRAMGCATFALHVPCKEQAVARVTIQCYVIDKHPPCVILGMDFILRHSILYDALKGVVTLQSCRLRTKALHRAAKTEPAGNSIVAHVSTPPPLDVIAPDMRAPLDMDSYQLPFTVVPNHPHSEALPVFDDGISAEFQECFLHIFSCFPDVWWPELGLLRSGEAMCLPSITLDANPCMFKLQLYCVSPRDWKAIDLVFDELTQQGRLTTAPPGMPCGWPVFVVYHEGKPRLVIDLRQLNDVVEPDAYPLLTPDELWEQLAGANFITTFDLRKAFYQMPLHSDDHWKATVLMHRSQETLSCTIMGQSCSVTFLQRVLTDAFKTAGLSDIAFVYVDNFSICSDMLDEHEQHSRAVLGVIQSLGLTLARDKVHVVRKEVPLLGHLVSGKGTCTMPSKCEVIKSIPYPLMLNQLEHVVGFFSYYKNYVPHFSALIAPLQRLKTTLLRPCPKTGQARKRYCARTSVPEDSSARQSLAELKSILQDRALRFPDYTKPFLLYVDASQQHGFALALHQNRGAVDTDADTDTAARCIDAIHPDSVGNMAEVPVWFDSRALTLAEKSYWPTKLEVAAAVWVLFRVKRFLDASPGPHLLFMDHLAVTSIADAKPFSTTPAARNLRLVCFSLILVEFCLKLRILHRKGMYMAHVDALSCIQASETASASFHVQELVINPGLVADILQSQQTDSALKCLHVEIETKAGDSLPFNNGSFCLNADNILCKLRPNGVWQLCVGKTALPRVIGLAHTGHLGAKATFDRFRAVGYAPCLLRHVEDYVKRCTHCQQTHTLRHRPYGALQLLLAPDTPFTTISCDFVVWLPLVRTAFDLDLVDMVLVLTDTATRRVYLLSGRSTWSAERWSLWYADRLLPHIGWPLKIISDCNSRLTSLFWRSLNERYGCELVFSTAHHKSDGQSERAIQSVELLLQGLCNAWLDDWAMHLPLVELLLGNHINTSMNAAPNDLLFGLHLHDPFTALQSVMTLGDLTLPDCRVALRQQALDHLALVQAYMRLCYDSLHEPPPQLAVGNWVWLELHDGYSLPPSLLPTDRRLGVQRVSPYPIKRVISNLTYELILPPGSWLHLVISIQHLKPYVPSEKPITNTVITAILKERKTHQHGHQYLVRFEHAGQDQWVPENTVTNIAVLEGWRIRRNAALTAQDGVAPPATEA